jgi:hypothetical protein
MIDLFDGNAGKKQNIYTFEKKSSLCLIISLKAQLLQ